jgi:hypothetical protein
VKIKATVAGYGPRPGKTHALVDVNVDFQVSKEVATFRVRVPNAEGEKAAEELAVARARDLARKFAAAAISRSA